MLTLGRPGAHDGMFSGVSALTVQMQRELNVTNKEVPEHEVADLRRSVDSGG